MVETPEQLARQNIDALLGRCGWVVQDKNAVNLSAGRGIAVSELSFKTGEPDYTLFVDGKALGTVEAKPEGHSLTGVEEQSAKYVTGVPFGLPHWASPLPFSFESTGAESERFKSFDYADLLKRDKVNLDIFWLKDDSLEESANLPAPEVIAREIADDLEAALEQFASITEDLI